MNQSTLIAFNKPYGVICQFSPHEKHATLKHYIPIPEVYPAGRLDTDSEGLLLLTSNGALQSRISHPRNKMLKTYWAQVEGTPDVAKLQQLQRGVVLKEFTTQPAKVRLLTAAESNRLWPRNPPIRVRQTVSDFWLEIKITEGKNRQVRRMCAKVGWPCLRLVRVAIGPLNIFDMHLGLGQWQQIESGRLISG
ncbi:pseudouridine synthase [Neisseriaceae bacterium ESL0693]|nr:pseudouridine synthase [Neisseriaceae bacterium ESL0693]